ncbi:MAG: peptidylprolyl isomerase [Bacteroidetes bacterium]|nr:MAG: peptidylprolyl isomerase [Bacteroidota bacterium]
MKQIACFLAILLAIGALRAQTIDRIVAVIGDEIVLESDVDNQYNYLIINGEKDDGTLRCQVMNNLIINKLLLTKARQDSILVSEAEVLAEADRRIQYILDQMKGDESEFVKIYGKPVIQFREDIKDEIEEELLIDRQRMTILNEATITPREVKQFFKSIPTDSTGLLPAEVMVNQIVITPPFSEESKKAAREKLMDIRRQILEGADFATMARRYSQGPSGPNGGFLGQIRRGQMVPEFEAVVYNMREGEVSRPFETEFGYHIAKLHKRTGEVLEASHILIVPSRSANGDSIAISKLKEVLELIRLDSLTFEQAAIRFSDDRASKDCGGCIVNPENRELRIPLNALPADLFFQIDEMEPGEISEPVEFTKPDGTRAFRIVYLKSKIPPHKPNLKDDYKTIRNAALRAKQSEIFEKWLESAKKNIYIDIKPTECSNALKNWVQ